MDGLLVFLGIINGSHGFEGIDFAIAGGRASKAGALHGHTVCRRSERSSEMVIVLRKKNRLF